MVKFWEFLITQLTKENFMRGEFFSNIGKIQKKNSKNTDNLENWTLEIWWLFFFNFLMFTLISSCMGWSSPLAKPPNVGLREVRFNEPPMWLFIPWCFLILKLCRTLKRNMSKWDKCLPMSCEIIQFKRLLSWTKWQISYRMNYWCGFM